MIAPVEVTALRTYVGVVPDPSPDHLARLRRDVLTRIATDTASSRGGVWWSSRVVSVGAAGVLVLGAATAIGVTHLPHAKHPSGAAAGSVDSTTALINATSAGETLRLLANHTNLAQPVTAKKGSFLYTKERELVLQTVVGADGPAAYFSELVRETWANVDDLRDVRITGTRGLNAHALTPADEVKLRRYGIEFDKVVPFEAHPAPAVRPGHNKNAPDMGNPTPAYLASLPTDPNKLLEVLRAENATSNGDTTLADSLIFKTIPVLATHVDAVISPQLRSALYQVLGLLPGVQRLPGQVDILGRTGVAVTDTVNDDRRLEIIFDPKTARIIGTAEVAIKDMEYADNVRVPKDTVLHAKFSEQTVVTKAGATS
jgi:hypothetical protein